VVLVQTARSVAGSLDAPFASIRMGFRSIWSIYSGQIILKMAIRKSPRKREPLRLLFQSMPLQSVMLESILLEFLRINPYRFDHVH
jgi:hypothetical protein